jgi:hypothetical protein
MPCCCCSSAKLATRLTFSKPWNSLRDAERILIWMSEKENVISSVEQMSYFYEFLMRELQIDRSSTTSLKQCFLEGGRPVFVPNEVSDSRYLVAGKMVKLADVTQKCKLEEAQVAIFDFPNSPVVFLDSIYPSSISTYFFAQRVCNPCRAIEGMFGARGVCAETFASGACTCNLKSTFAEYLPGIRLGCASPSLKNSIDVLRELCSEYNKIGVVADSSIEQPFASIFITKIRNLQTTISNNLWKCFNIPSSLHPYSAASIREMMSIFFCEPLLLTVENKLSTAISTDGRPLVFISDKEWFNIFKDELSQISLNFTLINATHNAVIEFDTIDSEESDYDVDSLDCFEKEFIGLSRDTFLAAASTINPKTYFAPMTIVPLLKCLKLSPLSDKISTSWNYFEAMTKEHSLVYLVNRLLRVSQLLVYAEYVESGQAEYKCSAYTHGERFKRLREMKIIAYSLLEKSVSVKINDIDLKKTLPKTFFYERETNTLHIQKDIPQSDQFDVAISIVMSAIRKQTAILENNQKFEFMRKIEDNLRKCQKFQKVFMLLFLL